MTTDSRPLTAEELAAARSAIERGDMVMFSPDVAEDILATLDAARAQGETAANPAPAGLDVPTDPRERNRLYPHAHEPMGGCRICKVLEAVANPAPAGLDVERRLLLAVFAEWYNGNMSDVMYDRLLAVVEATHDEVAEYARLERKG